MARLDHLLFGYRNFKVAADDIPKLCNMLLKLGLSTQISKNGDFALRERDVKTFISHAKGRIRFNTGDMLGLPGFFYGMRYRFGLLAGLIFAVILSVFMSGLVWDIRIDGNERLTDDEVVSLLATHGFEIGDIWTKKDKNRIEADILSSESDISWITINRRGTVAYVEVIESENIGIVYPEVPKYSNIVAERDAVIDEITVERGTAMVKVGDVVKKGDILISGVMQNEYGNILTRAVGTVKGTGIEEMRVESSREYMEKTAKKKIISQITVKIFKQSIKIFKNSGNSAVGCDIINKTYVYNRGTSCKIPISLNIEYCQSYDESVKEYDDRELVKIAVSDMNARIRERFSDADVLKLTTDGEFTGDGYMLFTEILYSSNIGKETEIVISNEAP